MLPNEWLDKVAYHALGYRQSLEATYDIATSLLARNVPGDFVECGVFAGAHCAVMARAIMDLDANRRVHVFDSFEGLPSAEPRDQEIWNHHGPKTGESTRSLSQVKGNLKNWGIPDHLLVYHPGWFADTIPLFRAALPKIAFLRLDGDLYSSTRDCMPLESLVVEGGWICVDDFNLTGCREAIFEKLIPAPIYWRKPTK